MWIKQPVAVQETLAGVPTAIRRKTRHHYDPSLGSLWI
jgi:hypothetical protein